jgi:hypothetical protein
VDEADADQGLAPRGRLDRRHARLRVLVDVGVQLLEILERLRLAHHLHEGGDGGVGRAGGRRVGHLDLALEDRLEKVGPAARRRHALLAEQLDVEAEAEGPGVDTHRPVAGLLGLPDGPRVELPEVRRLVDGRQALLGRLQMGITGPAEPDVCSGVRRLGLELREHLARALLRDGDLDPALAGEFVGHGLAPLELHAAVHVEATLRGDGPRRAGHHPCDDHHDRPRETSWHERPPAPGATAMSLAFSTAGAYPIATAQG